MTGNHTVWRLRSGLLARLVFAAFTLSITSLSGTALAIQSDYEVGADAGSFSAGNSGTGSWSLPIEAVPGILGMAPNMSVNVSTTASNGLLGVSGSLSGLSAITRCTQTIAQDGQNSILSLAASDEYCLDGNRLKLISGTQGSTNSEYRTEIESFQRIIANTSNATGPGSFTVTSRSGTQLTFGGTSESKISHDSGAVLSWRISRLMDTSGNYMDYIYASDSPEPLLEEIQYGGNTAGQSSFLAVDVVYEDRPDPSSGYRLGSLSHSTKRVAAIQTVHDGQIVRDYQFSYGLTEVSALSRLTQVQECAGSGKCLAPTTFTFTAEDDAWQTSSVSIPSSIEGPGGKPHGLYTDLNNDGWTDWIVSVRHSSGNIDNQTWLGSASGFYSSSSIWQLPALLYDYQLHASGIGTAQLVDINGDGYLDVIQAYQTSSGTTQNVWLNTGNGFTATAQFTLPDVFVSTVNLDRGELRLRFAELNGDGLADALVYTRDRNSVITRQAWINHGTGWTANNQWLPEVLLSDYADATFPDEYEHGTLVDINGDGLPDWVQAIIDGAGISTKQTWLNNGNGWALDNNYALPIELLDYDTHKQGHPKARLVDLNGDGLLDIAYAITQIGGTSSSSAWLNTGEGWLSASESSAWALPASMLRYQTNGITDMLGAMMDLNGDGQPEYVQSYQDTSNNITFNAWAHDGSSWQSSSANALPIALFKHHSNASSTGYAHLADINSDGIVDVFTARSGQTNTVYTHPTPPAGEIAGRLSEVQNGLGMQTQIGYATSNDASVYTPSTQTPWPNIANNSNRVLIQSLKTSNGLGDWNEAFHHYEKAKVNVTGRGSLGYQSHSAADGRSGITVTTRFYQDYPFTGLTESSSNKLANGTPLAASTSTPAQISLNQGQTVYAYIAASESDLFDLQTSSWIQKTVLSTTKDHYGNTTQSVETLTNVAGEQLTKTRTVTPVLDLNNWILDKTGTTTEVLSQPGKPDHTTTVNHSEYYAGSNRLKTEVLEPGEAHSLTSTYEYDAYGNRTKTTITPTTTQTPALTPRVTTSHFGSDGRFPVSVSNTLGHTATSEYDGRFGKPLITTDANGIKKKYVYDSFGTQLDEIIDREGVPEPDGKEVAIPHWCEVESYCPDNAVYFVAALDNQFEAPETAYYDMYGREIRRTTHGLGGAVVYQDTHYDAFGRKDQVTRQYFKEDYTEGATNIPKTTTQYDILDRPISVTRPDNGTTTVSYTGLNTTTTNPLGQVNDVTKNILGKAKVSTDALGNSTQFSYDVRGNLLSTTDSAGNQIINSYDHFGRKTAMDDQDMGQWSYDYDAFGQMTEQTDAKLQTVTMVYDDLGRVISRSEAEGQTTWTYDTATNGIGKLNSTSGPGYSNALQYDDLGRPIVSTMINHGQSYITETGYQGVTGKVDWVKYPSGVVVHKRYDDYGFPTTLESIDLDEYSEYKSKIEEANTYYRNAQILEAQYGLDFEELKAELEPIFDQINAAYSSAQPYLDSMYRNADKESQHFDLYEAYKAELDIHNLPYEAHIDKAKDDLDTANGYMSSANHNLSEYYSHMRKGCSYRGWYWSTHGDCSGIGPGSYTVTYNSSAASNWFNAAAMFGNQYDDDMDDYDRYIDKANAHYSDAAPYEEKVSIYDAQYKSHLNIVLRIRTRLKYYEDQATPYYGRWESKATAGNNCKEWSQKSEFDDICVTEIGAYQEAWDLAAEGGKYERYQNIVEQIEFGNAAIEVADTLKADYEQSATVYWTAVEADADGQIKKAEYANGVESEWLYDEMGRVGNIQTTTNYTDATQQSTVVQNELYDYDTLGNLSWRHDMSVVNTDLREDFSYDALNRLTSATISGSGTSAYQLMGLDTINLTYDALGNILSKTDTGSYAYGATNAGPHAVTSIFGSKNATYSYDDNGNLSSGDGRTIAYTSFNKPHQINKAGNTTDMDYGSGRELIRQVETQNAETTTTTYVGGLYEESEKNGITKAKHHLTIAGQTVAVVNFAVQLDEQSPPNIIYSYEDTRYLHRDHLNSITAITDQDGKLIERFHYDAFGKRRTAIVAPLEAPFANIAAAGFFPVTSRGYTGHKQLQSSGLIHMGGRVYDPEIGRFLSADPHIQSPLNTQSLNRYSYVNNNPLSYTDPSGYFSFNPLKAIKKLFKKIGNLISKVVRAVVKAVSRVVKKVVKAIKKYYKVIIAVAIAVVAPQISVALLSSLPVATATIIGGAVGGGLAGLVTTGTLRGMLIGAVSGAAFAGIGNAFSRGGSIGAGGIGKMVNAGEISTGTARALKTAAHGIVGGTRSVLSGGTFKAGFSSAGFTQAFAPAIDHIPDGAGGAGQIVAAGVVGGTASELAGGEFEDGFVTGVFSRGFNDNFHKTVQGFKDFFSSSATRKMVANYYIGGGNSKTLTSFGVDDDFEASPSVRTAEMKLMYKGGGTELIDNTYQDNLFALGQGRLKLNNVSCGNGNCTGSFSYNDMFEDPLSLGIEIPLVLGTPMIILPPQPYGLTHSYQRTWPQ